MLEPLTFYNSLTRKKEPFIPLDDKHVKLYVCGPTVYARPHLGNARPLIIFDVIYRLLKSLYTNVTYVRNITDIDDKINKAAQKKRTSIQGLTTQIIALFHQDIEALDILPPSFEPKATEHIPQIIEMIKILIEKGNAYEQEKHVLFRVSKFSSYGCLSRKNTKEIIAGARVEKAPFKEDPKDFVLWKPSDEGLPGWESPWGRGRPGWHIECSAMSKTYLGEKFDIHGGGIDLIFPHHENERAQSCSAHNTKEMANFWLHNGHLKIKGEKMSKSLGNSVMVHSLLEKYSSEAIRFVMLSTHYRQPMKWEDKTLSQAEEKLSEWYQLLPENPSDEEQLDPQFLNALFDDLNTPQAFYHLHRIAKLIEKEPFSTKEELRNIFYNSGKLLGLFGNLNKKKLNDLTYLEPEILSLIEQREGARQQKDFLKADAIRDTLEEKGIILKDTTFGKTQWYRKKKN